jgi:tetratricopeptide (TPR) repeat protein
MAERLLYLPAAGFAGCVVLTIYAASGRHRKTAAAVLTLIIALAGARTYARNLDWMDDETLWTQAVKASPDSFKTHLGLAEVRLYNQPLDAAMDGAIVEEERAMRIVDGLPLDKSPNNVYAELGELYRLKGEAVAPKKADGTAAPSSESLIWYDKALRVLSHGAAIDRAVAVALRRQELGRGKGPGQVAPFGLDRLYASLGLTNLRLHRESQALQAFLEQRRLDPGNPAIYRSIAAAHRASGNLRAAAIALIQIHLLSDSDLDQAEIRDLYQGLEPASCAVRQGFLPTLDLDCPLVKSDICASLLDLAGALLEGRIDAGVKQMKSLARERYTCPMEAFESLSR